MMPSPSNDSSENIILISEARLQRFGFILLFLSIIFGVIGGFVSPRDNQGKPVLLLPEVKEIENYRRLAKTWINKLVSLDSDISGVISVEQQGDIFTQSRQSEQIFQDAVELVQEIDRSTVPPIGAGFHDQLSNASLAYLEAARTALQWVSDPEAVNYDSSLQKLEQARNLRVQLEANPWLKNP
jgi:hypothetical protein